MSDFSIFDGAMSCIVGVLSTAPAQYQVQHKAQQHQLILGVYSIPKEYTWKICSGIPHQGKDGHIKMEPPEAPDTCASPDYIAKELGLRVCPETKP